MIPGKKEIPCFRAFEFNQGALQLSKNSVSNSNSKHIDVRHHFLRELVHQGDIISVNHVSSKYQHTDILPKDLAFDLFATRRRFLTSMYGHTYSKSMDQPGKVTSPARGQLDRKNEYFPVRVRV